MQTRLPAAISHAVDNEEEVAEVVPNPGGGWRDRLRKGHEIG